MHARGLATLSLLTLQIFVGGKIEISQVRSIYCADVQMFLHMYDMRYAEIMANIWPSISHTTLSGRGVVIASPARKKRILEQILSS